MGRRPRSSALDRGDEGADEVQSAGSFSGIALAFPHYEFRRHVGKLSTSTGLRI